MTSTQIKYFVTAARCLNFTEAAKQLYITQPALSQQITAIESELNIQLFIREKNKLRLTPAATFLLEELPAYQRHYEEIIEKARIVNQGNYGLLRIGVLQAQMLTENFRRAFANFRKEYPNVGIQLSVDTFSGLKQKLDSDKLDVIFTIDFEVAQESTYQYELVDRNVGVALVSDLHPLCGKKDLQLADLKNESIIAVNHVDTEAIRTLIVRDCEAAGFVPNLLLASSVDEQMLWIDAGLGVGIINENSYIAQNPTVQHLEGLSVGENYYSIAWRRDTENPVAKLFGDYVKEYVKSCGIA